MKMFMKMFMKSLFLMSALIIPIQLNFGTENEVLKEKRAKENQLQTQTKIPKIDLNNDSTNFRITEPKDEESNVNQFMQLLDSKKKKETLTPLEKRDAKKKKKILNERLNEIDEIVKEATNLLSCVAEMNLDDNEYTRLFCRFWDSPTVWKPSGAYRNAVLFNFLSKINIILLDVAERHIKDVNVKKKLNLDINKHIKNKKHFAESYYTIFENGFNDEIGAHGCSFACFDAEYLCYRKILTALESNIKKRIFKKIDETCEINCVMNMVKNLMSVDYNRNNLATCVNDFYTSESDILTKFCNFFNQNNANLLEFCQKLISDETINEEVKKLIKDNEKPIIDGAFNKKEENIIMLKNYENSHYLIMDFLQQNLAKNFYYEIQNSERMVQANKLIEDIHNFLSLQENQDIIQKHHKHHAEKNNKNMNDILNELEHKELIKEINNFLLIKNVEDFAPAAIKIFEIKYTHFNNYNSEKIDGDLYKMLDSFKREIQKITLLTNDTSMQNQLRLHYYCSLDNWMHDFYCYRNLNDDFNAAIIFEETTLNDMINKFNEIINFEEIQKFYLGIHQKDLNETFGKDGYKDILNFLKISDPIKKMVDNAINGATNFLNDNENLKAIINIHKAKFKYFNFVFDNVENDYLKHQNNIAKLMELSPYDEKEKNIGIFHYLNCFANFINNIDKYKAKSFDFNKKYLEKFPKELKDFDYNFLKKNRNDIINFYTNNKKIFGKDYENIMTFLKFLPKK